MCCNRSDDHDEICLSAYKETGDPDNRQHEPDHGRRNRNVRRLPSSALEMKIKFACVDGPEFDGHLVDFDEAMKRQQMYKTEEGRAMLKLQEGDTHHGGCGNCGGDK